MKQRIKHNRSSESPDWSESPESVIVFVEVEDVADVTVVLPTTVVETGHVRALVGSSRSGFLGSEMRVFVDTKVRLCHDIVLSRVDGRVDNTVS
jgi:hypothetical protein